MPKVAPLVFVSSTSKDLAEYRAAIWKHFPALDVLYRGMEFFGARPERARKTMLEELLKCDLYLGIFGDYYGSKDVAGVSYTELEYRFAEKHTIPRLVFLLERPANLQLAVQDLDDALKLAKLKLDAQTNATTDNFSTAEELIQKIVSALRQWLSANDERWKSLRQLPLTDRESSYIDDLYSPAEETVIEAIHQLGRPDNRAALEHFYGLLCSPNTSRAVAEEVFRKIIFSADSQRLTQILIQTIVNRPSHRARAIKSIGERAAVASRNVCNQELDSVLRYVTDPDWEVRLQVAHSLSNIGVSRTDRIADCRKGIESLQEDKDARVKKEVPRYLERLQGRSMEAD